MKRVVLALSLLASLPALARVIQVAQVSTEKEVPAVQRLDARHALIIEKVKDGYPGMDRLVVYDTMGIEAPREVTPPGFVAWNSAAAWEGSDGTLRLLASGTLNWSTGAVGTRFSADGGLAWKSVAFPAAAGQVALGTAEVPFVCSVGYGYWTVDAGGALKPLTLSRTDGAYLIGSDREGKRFLVTLFRPSTSIPGIAIVDLQGNAQYLFDMSLDSFATYDGWITSDGSAYVSAARSGGPYWLGFWSGGAFTLIASSESGQYPVATPTADHSGAWIAINGSGYTALALHTPATGLVEKWRDTTAPWVVSLHAGASGERVLVQTRRYRHVQAWGMGLWTIGSPQPPAYDELLLTGDSGPFGFVHLDVDAAAAGQPIWIDTGNNEETACPGTCFPAPKPLGLVRASLKQRLAIPAAAHQAGVNGADWRTDLLIRNPESTAVNVTARFLPNPGNALPAADAKLTIAPGAIAVLPDVLATLFHLESGSGAILILPEGNRGVRATSRTYTRSAKGTYGMSVDAVDAQSASAVGYPTTFAGALLGSGFRTNVVAADVLGLGASVDVSLSDVGGSGTLVVPANGQAQINGLSGENPSATRAARLTATSGTVMPGLTAIDGATNDPSWFGPDLHPDWIGCLPALVHADGINGARFRTDLYLFNPQPISRWMDIGEKGVSLAPGESRVIPDALFTLFGRTGAETTCFDDMDVRITSRTYTIEPDGSTYGTVIPPLDSLEYAGSGETLEILGPVGGAGFRTNLALLSLTSDATAVVEILDETGTLRSMFEARVPARTTVQIDDLFRARGLGDGPVAAAIRVTGASAAYATTIDNGTNDPVYFAGALGSH